MTFSVQFLIVAFCIVFMLFIGALAPIIDALIKVFPELEDWLIERED